MHPRIRNAVGVCTAFLLRPLITTKNKNTLDNYAALLIGSQIALRGKNKISGMPIQYVPTASFMSFDEMLTKIWVHVLCGSSTTKFTE